MAHQQTGNPSSLRPQHLTPDQSSALVRLAEARFQRVLPAWAADMLELRRRELVRPSWNPAIPAQHPTKPPASQGPTTFMPMNDAA